LPEKDKIGFFYFLAPDKVQVFQVKARPTFQATGATSFA